MADIRFTCSEASLLLEKLSNSCREWSISRKGELTCQMLDSHSLADLHCIENELLHTLADVRMSRNAQRPVNRLPVEILSKIFHQILPPLTPYLEGFSRERFLVWDSFFDFKDTDALLPLSHICRRWRDVALDTPTLWTTICNSSHPDAIDEYSLRSRGVPLKVLDIENKHLDVQQLSRTDGQHVQSLASYTECDLVLPTSYAQGLHALAAWYCLLQGDVSNLKALVLRSVDWHLPGTLTNLTHLFLANKQLHIVDLFRILSIAPRLEDLGLWAISAKEAFDPREDIPAVTLKHLRRLGIYWPDRNIASGFFSHVGLPARLAVNFEYCEVPDLQWLVPLTRNDAKSLYISDDSVIAAGPSKALRFKYKDDSGGMIQWIVALLSHFQLKDIWIAYSYNWYELNEAVIKHTPWVETLHLGIVDSTTSTMTESLGNNPTYWPKLTKVILSRPDNLFGILKLARSRARLGCPLEELEFHESRSMVSEEYSEDLENIKSHVEVVRLIEDGPIALPLPDICQDGVPSPYFWPKKWSAMPNRLMP
ncbi:predicted protein [Postia placenta Mad-698-R]|nr:predicted protein [Postia placenta Mad-698-R]